MSLILLSTEFGEETALEDASLDLSAYYQTLENLGSWLRAHDGTEFDDMAATLEAAGYSLDDFTQSLAAYLQSVEDLGVDLSSVATWREDLAQWLAAYFQSLENQPVDLEALATVYDHLSTHLDALATGYMNLATPLSLYGRDIADQPMLLHAAGYYKQDLASYLAAASSTVFIALATYLAATDGSTLTTLGLHLIARSRAPSFTASIAQRVSSIATEVS